MPVLSKRLRILAVEDDADARELYEQYFRGEGDEVVTTDDSNVVAALTSSITFDVVLVDLLMQELSGIEVISALRATSSMKETPIVVVTALKRQDEWDAAKAAGATTIVLKPVQFPALRELLLELVV